MDYKKYNDYELLYLLDWHSEEALNILIKKYDNLIKIKLRQFRVLDIHHEDYLQELRMLVVKSIKKYCDYYGKTLCRYLELIIERKIMRMLSEDVYYYKKLVYSVDFLKDKETSILDKMIYEERIAKIKEERLDDFKKCLLQEVLLKGESVKEFSLSHNVTEKEVYNHVYSLRIKLKRKINL